jgi:hypothetical protein
VLIPHDFEIPFSCMFFLWLHERFFKNRQKTLARISLGKIKYWEWYGMVESLRVTFWWIFWLGSCDWLQMQHVLLVVPSDMDSSLSVTGWCRTELWKNWVMKNLSCLSCLRWCLWLLGLRPFNVDQWSVVMTVATVESLSTFGSTHSLSRARRISPRRVKQGWI